MNRVCNAMCVEDLLQSRATLKTTNSIALKTTSSKCNQSYLKHALPSAATDSSWLGIHSQLISFSSKRHAFPKNYLVFNSCGRKNELRTEAFKSTQRLRLPIGNAPRRYLKKVLML